MSNQPKIKDTLKALIADAVVPLIAEIKNLNATVRFVAKKTEEQRALLNNLVDVMTNLSPELKRVVESVLKSFEVVSAKNKQATKRNTVPLPGANVWQQPTSVKVTPVTSIFSSYIKDEDGKRALIDYISNKDTMPLARLTEMLTSKTAKYSDLRKEVPQLKEIMAAFRTAELAEHKERYTRIMDKVSKGIITDSPIYMDADTILNTESDDLDLQDMIDDAIIDTGDIGAVGGVVGAVGGAVGSGDLGTIDSLHIDHEFV